MSERPAAPRSLVVARRAWIPLAALVLGAAGVLVTVTPASAGSRPHHYSGGATGSISCSFSARVSFSPSLTSSGGGTRPSAVRAQLSRCTASDSSVHISGGTAQGSFASSPVQCSGHQLEATGAAPSVKVSWRGRLGAKTAHFTATTVNDAAGTGSFAGPAVFTFSLGGSNGACSAKRGAKRAVLTGVFSLTDPAPSYGPATSVINSGYGNACAITSSGLVCWGGNSNGALAQPSVGPDSCNDDTDSCSKIPVPIGISAVSVVQDVGGYCAILTSSAVDCWGSNDSGDLGIGTTGGPDTCDNDTPCSTSPVSVGISATSLAADGTGGYCAILTTKAVDCWGDNSFGELGAGLSSSGPQTCDGSPCSTSPVSTGIFATSLAATNSGYCAILTTKAVDCWGDNEAGTLGAGTTTGPDICGGYSGDLQLPCSTKPVPTGISATSLIAGAQNYCAILTSGGIDCWGDNSDGELGAGVTSGPETCIYSTACSPSPVSTGLSGTAAASYGNSVCAVLTSRAVDCWGAALGGQLGDGSDSGPDTCGGWGGVEPLSCSTSPVSTGISATSVTAYQSGYCATLTSGEVDCWGTNYAGELGDGDATGPQVCDEFDQDVPCSTTPVSTGISAVSLYGGAETICAILSSGAVDCWGSGFDGGLGDASESNSDVPVGVVGIGP